MAWDIINGIVFISPLLWIWGWTKYWKLPQRSHWRARASLVGLCAPVLSIAVWCVMLLMAHGSSWPKSSPAIGPLTTLGCWIPILGMLVGLAGRPLLIVAIIPSSIGTILFWFATTLP